MHLWLSFSFYRSCDTHTLASYLASEHANEEAEEPKTSEKNNATFNGQQPAANFLSTETSYATNPVG